MGQAKNLGQSPTQFVVPNVNSPDSGDPGPSNNDAADKKHQIRKLEKKLRKSNSWSRRWNFGKAWIQTNWPRLRKRPKASLSLNNYKLNSMDRWIEFSILFSHCCYHKKKCTPQKVQSAMAFSCLVFWGEGNFGFDIYWSCRCCHCVSVVSVRLS